MKRKLSFSEYHFKKIQKRYIVKIPYLDLSFIYHYKVKFDIVNGYRKRKEPSFKALYYFGT